MFSPTLSGSVRPNTAGCAKYVPKLWPCLRRSEWDIPRCATTTVRRDHTLPLPIHSVASSGPLWALCGDRWRAFARAAGCPCVKPTAVQLSDVVVSGTVSAACSRAARHRTGQSFVDEAAAGVVGEICEVMT